MDKKSPFNITGTIHSYSKSFKEGKELTNVKIDTQCVWKKQAAVRETKNNIETQKQTNYLVVFAMICGAWKCTFRYGSGWLGIHSTWMNL